MIRTIIFPFDDEKTIKRKVNEIKSIIGSENVNTYELTDTQIPYIDVNCSKEEWKRIKFRCGLSKCYW